ncbi:MAG: hypothetical protein COU85_01450 [Candidatus Portnoybacteria bacterium CG10_big_fil_rev_8_21_14_0_10_44_7]|uniref:Uncharacterized protein n=1 Tax=Candidatus Portnoybacteria bacterium CG10_big_fil_rev_8_21_14_0_10_44_7 TaxID=1974816 RepID=A0A2M8KIV9_9BACT|nr:MAG: hypothetical protein COU85_01450 [Candidatus Portnoybacteria bacterium CG10_big_fil_rev_8_21_14_0_10_44_7]
MSIKSKLIVAFLIYRKNWPFSSVKKYHFNRLALLLATNQYLYSKTQDGPKRQNMAWTDNEPFAALHTMGQCYDIGQPHV